MNLSEDAAKKCSDKLRDWLKEADAEAKPPVDIVLTVEGHRGAMAGVPYFAACLSSESSIERGA